MEAVGLLDVKVRKSEGPLGWERHVIAVEALVGTVTMTSGTEPGPQLTSAIQELAAAFPELGLSINQHTLTFAVYVSCSQQTFLRMCNHGLERLLRKRGVRLDLSQLDNPAAYQEILS